MAGGIVTVLRYLRHAATECADESDARLVEQFVATRSEDAFAALLGRYGPLVMGVCRRVLTEPADAEDAFQATFLVLARRAGSLRKHDSLAVWLHRVALNLARTALVAAARRKSHERQAVRMAPANEAAERDWQPILHEEVDRLPEKYRIPIVLCYFQGLTHDDAARQLGWPVGSVKGRLARPRDLLRTRLARCGLALAAGGVAALLAEGATGAAVPPALLGLTLRAAVAFAAGGAGVTSANALLLAKGALPNMAMRMFLCVALLLATGIAGVVLATAAWRPDQAETRQDTGREKEGPAPNEGGHVPVFFPVDKEGPVESEPVRVAGLEFVALVAPRMTAPASGAREVELGLRVKNVSDEDVTIPVFDVIQLLVFDVAQGRKLEVNIRRKDGPRAVPPVTLAPGATWTWKPRAKLERTTDRATLRLSGADGLGILGAWDITTLRPGKYRLTVEYANAAAKLDNVPLWVGKAVTKAIEFEIRPVAEQPKGAAREELDRLQGTWHMVATEADGKPVPPANVNPNDFLTIEGTEFLFKSGLRGLNGEFTIDPSKEPKWMDQTTSGGQMSRGIYKLDGDTLRVLLGPAGGERPTEFKTRQGDKLWIRLYQRVKAPAAAPSVKFTADRDEVARLKNSYPNGHYFVDTIHADGTIVWTSQRVVGDRVETKRWDLRSVDEVRSALVLEAVSREAAFQVHLPRVNPSIPWAVQAAARAQEILNYLRTNGWRRAGPVAN